MAWLMCWALMVEQQRDEERRHRQQMLERIKRLEHQLEGQEEHQESAVPTASEAPRGQTTQSGSQRHPISPPPKDSDPKQQVPGGQPSSQPRPISPPPCYQESLAQDNLTFPDKAPPSFIPDKGPPSFVEPPKKRKWFQRRSESGYQYHTDEHNS